MARRQRKARKMFPQDNLNEKQGGGTAPKQRIRTISRSHASSQKTSIIYLTLPREGPSTPKLFCLYGAWHNETVAHLYWGPGPSSHPTCHTVLLQLPRV